MVTVVVMSDSDLTSGAGLMVTFLLLAKGWSITRDNFSPNEWRGLIMSASAFYMCNSIVLVGECVGDCCVLYTYKHAVSGMTWCCGCGIQVLETSVLSQRGFWIANTILYGLMYLYIVLSIKTQLLSVYYNVSH
jgi:hypothetical protein